MKRAAWSSGSFSSEKPLAISRPTMKSSKRSVIAGLPVAGARQRRDFGRVVDDVGRVPQLGFGGFLEQHQLQRAEAGIGEVRRLEVDAQSLSFCRSQSHVVELLEAVAGVVVVDGADDGQAGEGLGQVQRAALVFEDLRCPAPRAPSGAAGPR
jgi:hypothetical protein